MVTDEIMEQLVLSLAAAQKVMDDIVHQTPSGDRRNKLSESNIFLLKSILKLQEATVIPLPVV